MTVEQIVTPYGPIDPEPPPELPARSRADESEGGLSQFGRAALGMVAGAALWRGLEMPGGLLLGALGGAVIGYFLPMPQMGGARDDE